MLCEKYLISFKSNKSTSYVNMCICVLRMHTSECLYVNIPTNKMCFKNAYMLTYLQEKLYMSSQTSHVHFAMSSSRQNNSTICHEKVDKLQSKRTSWLLNVDKSEKNFLTPICYTCRKHFPVLYSLCCLFFFDIRILITTLVSSNSSYHMRFHSK